MPSDNSGINCFDDIRHWFVLQMWNYYSPAKWEYSVPFVHEFKIFELPILGYAGYIPFGLGCAAIGNILEEGWQSSMASMILCVSHFIKNHNLNIPAYMAGMLRFGLLRRSQTYIFHGCGLDVH